MLNSIDKEAYQYPACLLALIEFFVCITDEYVGASAGVKALWDIVKFQ